MLNVQDAEQVNGSGMTYDVGAKLKVVRQSSGFSQRGLGRRSGVSNATISQIESGHLNPTLGLLKKILDGIPITLAAFFVEEAPPVEDRIFYTAQELTEIGRGGVSYKQVGSGRRRRAIQFLYEVYAPGASTGKIFLRHEGEECGLILKGCLEVTVEGRTRLLSAGDAYYFDSMRPHRFRNTGAKPCELVSACTPPSL